MVEVLGIADDARSIVRAFYDFLDCMTSFLMEVVLPVVTLGALGLGAIFVFVTTISYLDCRGFANGTGIETRWAWGCYANVDGRWVPSKYVFGETNEIRVKPVGAPQ